MQGDAGMIGLGTAHQSKLTAESTSIRAKVWEMYSSEEEVRSALTKRWNDKNLWKELNAFLSGNIPAPFASGPRAILGRQLATPNHEFAAFYEKAHHLKLNPICFEYLDDLFITNNPCKACLANITFWHGLDKYGEEIKSIFHTIKLSDNKHENKRISEITTLWDESLVNFHHRLLNAQFRVELFDGSRWLRDMGEKAATYYPRYLALLTIRHVLFESMEGGREERFFEQVFMPALDCVQKHFGLKPLIMFPSPPNEMSDKYWLCYPEQIKQMIKV